jgi:Fe-S cluster biogenesis protein NfuA
MGLRERIEKKIEEINPTLESLADGYVQVLDVDETQGIVKLRLFGGRLH